MNILMMGVPGSGKSTQAKKLAEELNLCYLSAGGLLRELAKKNTPLGKKIKKSLDNGILFDDKFVGGMVKVRLKHSDCSRGFVSDTYPRYLPQISIFDPKIERIFYLEVSTKVAVGRLLKRHRLDDIPVLIKSRIKLYKKITKDLIKYYEQALVESHNEKKVKIIYINGERGEEEIYKEIISFIRKEQALVSRA